MNKFKSMNSFKFSVNVVQQQARDMLNTYREHKHNHEHKVDECSDDEDDSIGLIESVANEPIVKVDVDVDIPDIYVAKEDVIESNTYNDVVLKLRKPSFKKVVTLAMDKFILRKPTWT